MNRNKSYDSKAEMILMGFTLSVENNEEAKYIIDYILKVMNSSETADTVIEKASKHCKDMEIKAINTSTVMGDSHLAFAIKTSEDEYEFNLVDEDGTFCFVYNISNPELSELGYCFFENQHGKVRRIG